MISPPTHQDYPLFSEGAPDSAAGARRKLIDGNRAFNRLVEAQYAAGPDKPHYLTISLQELGLGDRPGEVSAQQPFAAVIGCADARVPVELIFSQAADDLFVVRVAGNVLGEECLGSLDYAVDHVRSVRLLLALGHTGCGAVSAAVDAFLAPASYLHVAANLPLRAIIDSLMVPVRGAADALERAYGRDAGERPGYRAALVDTAAVLNAALTAAVMRHTFQKALGDRLGVVYAVYSLADRLAGLPSADETATHWEAGLFDPPADEAGFIALGERAARSGHVRRLLESAPVVDH